MLSEAIVYTCPQIFGCLRIGVDREVSVKAEGTHIIDAAHMVVVLMSKQDGIQTAESKPESLLAQVRRSVNENSHSVGFH